MKHDFQFPIMGHAPMGIRGWLIRYFARQTCETLAHPANTYYQMGGWEKRDYHMIDVDKYQLMHWVLFEAGYLCSTADVMERCGVNADRKPGPPDTLDIFDEVDADEPPWKQKNRWLRRLPVNWLKKY